MGNTVGDNQARKYLAAFADGELDIEQNLQVLEHMAMNPLATRRVMHQQQLRQAVARTMRGAAPQPPPSLRGRIVAQCSAPAPKPSPAIAPTPPKKKRFRTAWLGRWLPLAVAAVLVAFSTPTLYRAWVQPAGPSLTSLGATPIMAPALVDKFAWRHNGCARELQQLNDTARFPSNLKQMPKSLADYLGAQPYPVLDFSALGYDFWKAGVCIVPGKGINSVHLIYRRRPGTPGADAGAALSLWIADDKGQIRIAPDQPYLAAGADKPHPMIVWRHNGLVYYLMGDDLESVDQAVGLLRTEG